jgi:ribosomal RNA methyltransferase Nop2
MSRKTFFMHRYEKLGWKFEDAKLKQAIRINSLNTGTKPIAKRLRSLGMVLKKVPFLNRGYWIRQSKFSVGAASEYLLGYYSIQEAASQIPVTLFTNLNKKIVLDACAAPGGKTVQLSDRMRNTGAIIALDINHKRLNALTNQLERCHVSNTIVLPLDARQTSQLQINFDCILLDVPCSGNFVIDTNWFHKRTISDIRNNAQRQREILTEVSKVLKDEGELVYATCSLEPEENELNISWAIKTLNLQVDKINCYGQKALTNVFGKQLDPSIANCKRIWPGETQGFFVCKLKKKG